MIKYWYELECDVLSLHGTITKRIFKGCIIKSSRGKMERLKMWLNIKISIKKIIKHKAGGWNRKWM